MSWKKRIAIVVGVLIALYSITGFLVIPLIAESILPNKLREHLKLPASVEDVSFNPYTLNLSVEGINVKDKKRNKNFITAEAIFVNLQWSSLFELAVVCQEIQVTRPRLRLVRFSRTSYNFSDMLLPKQNRQKAPEDNQENEEPLRFSLSNISVSGGEVIFRDTPKDKTHRFSDIGFTLPKITNFDTDIQTYAEPVFTGTLDETQVRVEAFTQPFADSLATGINLSLSGLSLPRYIDYVPGSLGFAVSDGQLDIISIIAFTKGPEGNFDFDVSATADFSDLRLVNGDAEEILSLPGMHIEMAPSRILQNEVRLKALRLTEPKLTIVRRTNGELNLADLGLAESRPSQEQKDKSPEGASFDFQMSHFQLQSGTVRVRDFAAPRVSKTSGGGPVEMRMEDIELEVSDFANQTGHQADLDFSANIPPNGACSILGNFGVLPLSCDMQVNVKELGLKRVQPYIPNSVHARISDGRLYLSGNARLQAQSEDGINAAYKGDVRVSDLAVSEEQTGQDLTTWQSFAVREMDATWNPARVDIQTISISDLQQRLALEKDGQLNISTTYKKESTEPGPQEKTEESADQDKADTPGKQRKLPIPVSVGEIELSDIGLSFTDHTITPTYSSEFTLTKGSITGLSTAGAEAELFLKGVVDKHASVTIEGGVAPLQEDIMFDIQAKLGNLELSPLSPYARKYIGRNIEKAKLNVDMDYVLKDKQLEAENHVLLDQLSLGQEAEGDVGTDLPVGLIISLLKDRNGQIKLELPLSGRLDDPQFSLTGIVARSLQSIFANAATSPFAFASSLISGVSGGEELRYIEFSAGSTDLTNIGRDKLKNVQTLLYKRPKLHLVVTGYVNPEKDRQALADQRLEEKIRAARRADMTTKEDDEKLPDTEDIELTEEQYSKYLREIYKQDVLSDEDEKDFSDAGITEKEMKEKIRQRITIKDGQLRQLAERRRDAVKTFVLQDERISGKRLFTRRAETLSPSDPGAFSPARVELDLQ